MGAISLVKNVIEETLYEILLGCENIEFARKRFEEVFIMKYDDFINQIIFELYYDQYTKHCKGVALVEFYKQEILNDRNIKTIECTEDPEYKKLKRSYKKYRLHNDNDSKRLYEKMEKGKNLHAYSEEDNIQYHELKKPEERSKGHKLREYQMFQQKNLMNYKIFKHIENQSISSSKKVKDTDLIDMLTDFEKIYIDIEKSFDTYFEKCVQYYQLEIMCNIEIKYLIAEALSLINKKLEDKENDKSIFKALIGISFKNNYFQNRFVIGRQIYIDKYKEHNYNKFEDMPIEIYNLCKMKFIIKEIAKNKLLKEYNFSYDYTKDEMFFKNFLGMGQHINEKHWKDIKLKDFRDFCKSNFEKYTD